MQALRECVWFGVYMYKAEGEVLSILLRRGPPPDPPPCHTPVPSDIRPRVACVHLCLSTCINLPFLMCCGPRNSPSLTRLHSHTHVRSHTRPPVKQGSDYLMGRPCYVRAWSLERAVDIASGMASQMMQARRRGTTHCRGFRV